MVKPFSEACEQNKDDILSVIRPRFDRCRSILEIGSGTGQHAVYFARNLPQLIWQCSDVAENVPGIQMWLQESGLSNLPAAVDLNVDEELWAMGRYQGIFSANTSHIMSQAQVQRMFLHVANHLEHGGQFCLYGPFNADGFTSPSNERFHQWLQQQNPNWGLREICRLQDMAAAQGLILLEQISMPTNNKILVWGNKN